jgi:D-lyxose ketol-isomerase
LIPAVHTAGINPAARQERDVSCPDFSRRIIHVKGSIMTRRGILNRRSFLRAAGAWGGLATAGGAIHAAEPRRGKSKLQFPNADFYDQDGKYIVERGKDAILKLCKYHGYPIFPDLRDRLWVTDYGTGQYTQLGLAACIFVNNEEDRYMLLDIFLLPNQMLPEHWHVAGDKNPAKREGWLVRWGASHIVGIGEPNLSKDIVIPKCHCGGKVTVEHEVLAKPGMFVKLAQVESRHWQYAGPEGAIITEVANVHTNKAVRHTDPALNQYFLSQ